MNTSEIKALVTLLDDADAEVVEHVENQIKLLGETAIPYLENHWEENTLNPILQKKIETIIHGLQYQQVIDRLRAWKKNGATDLLEGMWLVATYQYPELQVDKMKQYLNDMYFDAWFEMRDDMHPHDQIRVLNQIFFDKHKFQANTKNFHSPANSMLNQVFDTKRGNPISLCVIYMLVARRLGLPIYGVNLPTLFVLTYKSPQIQFYVNVFNKGLIFGKVDIDNYIKQMNLEYSDSFYEPCTNLEIVSRVLRNLIVSFNKLGEVEKSKEVETILNAII